MRLLSRKIQTFLFTVKVQSKSQCWSLSRCLLNFDGSYLLTTTTCIGYFLILTHEYIGIYLNVHFNINYTGINITYITKALKTVLHAMMQCNNNAVITFYVKTYYIVNNIS